MLKLAKKAEICGRGGLPLAAVAVVMAFCACGARAVGFSINVR